MYYIYASIFYHSTYDLLSYLLFDVEDMAKRIPKFMAEELIQYAKSVEIRVHYWHPKSTSAMEFHRQMSSSKLRKINPIFKTSINGIPVTETPNLVAEFTDGSKWESETASFTAADLRAEFYSRAERVEEAMEEAGDAPDAPVDKGKKGDKGGKGGGKK